jgi:hypothetical protein
MKYLCLEYHDGPPSKQSIVQRCVAALDDGGVSRRYIIGPATDGASAAMTVRFDRGKIAVAPGILNDLRNHLRSIVVLEAYDLNHAIQLVTRLPDPALDGCIEIHPIDDDF